MIYPTLETERLVLTEIVDSDAEALFEIFSNESVIRYYDFEAFEDIEQARELIALFKSRFDTSIGLRWGIRDKQSPLLIGTCGFNSWVIPMKNAVIGYDIHPEFWRKGIAREAVGKMLLEGFKGSLPCGPLHRVQADTLPGNEASERLLLSLGFKFEGLRRDCGYWKNQYHDLKCYGLLADELRTS